MNFLELSSKIDDSEGYADFPYFQRDVWPLIRRKAKEVKSVFLFWNDVSSSLGWAGHYEMVTAKIMLIRPMAELTDDELSGIEHLSYYGGHFNVLYHVSTESLLIRELCNLYPTLDLSSDDVDQLGLGQESFTEFRAFTAALPKELIQFSFAHDADPLYIFGERETLEKLLVASVRGKQPQIRINR